MIKKNHDLEKQMKTCKEAYEKNIVQTFKGTQGENNVRGKSSNSTQRGENQKWQNIQNGQIKSITESIASAQSQLNQGRQRKGSCLS